VSKNLRRDTFRDRAKQSTGESKAPAEGSSSIDLRYAIYFTSKYYMTKLSLSMRGLARLLVERYSVIGVITSAAGAGFDEVVSYTILA
jgi:hypothetical protein